MKYILSVWSNIDQEWQEYRKYRCSKCAYKAYDILLDTDTVKLERVLADGTLAELKRSA